MNEMGLKEKAMAAVIVVIALYAVVVVTWFLYSGTAWRSAFKKYEREEKTFNKEERLISERNKWTEAYEAEKAAMPTFAAGRATDTTWLQKMGEVANRNLIQISQRGTQKEKLEIDDVTVLPIDASWEGSLEALVKFLYELENSKEGLFDVAELDFKPSAKKGYLRGTFALNCAYMRE